MVHLGHKALVAARFSSLIEVLRHSAVNIDAFAYVEQRIVVIIKAVDPTAAGQGVNRDARAGEFEMVGNHSPIFALPSTRGWRCPLFVSVIAGAQGAWFLPREPQWDSARKVPEAFFKIGG